MPSAQKYLNFNNDPNLNNSPAPVGAPENATAVSALNNIDRYDKAAIADLAQDVVTEGIGAQTPGAVNFTGGSITGLTAASTSGFTPSADADLTTKLYVDTQIANVQNTINATIDTVIPVGTVMMWNGLIANIPTYGTWQLCDGTNGTIDLRDVVIKGCDVDGNLGASGGSQSATTNGRALTEAQLPTFTPGLGTLAVANDTHEHLIAWEGAVSTGSFLDANTYMIRGYTIAGSQAYSLVGTTNAPDIGRSSGNTHNHNLTGSLASVGSGQTHDHDITIPEPVHRRIYFIQRTA